jgi:hypothetical protein
MTDKLTLNGQNTLSIYKGPNSIDGENLNSIPPDQINEIISRKNNTKRC